MGQVGPLTHAIGNKLNGFALIFGIFHCSCAQVILEHMNNKNK